jgi:hypothetical protein
MTEEKMLLQVRIPTDLHRKSKSLAVEHGKSLQQWVKEALEAKLNDPELAAREPFSSKEKARALREWAESHRNDLPLLSDEAISRESIYSDERL